MQTTPAHEFAIRRLVMGGEGIDVALQALSSVLWRERHTLDHLEYKLVTEHLLLRLDHSQWLVRASDEVASALDAVRTIELQRAVFFNDVAARLGMPSLVCLRDLILALTDPWQEIFDAHRRALELQTGVLDRLADQTRALLARDRQSVADALEELEAADGGQLGHRAGELALHLEARRIATRGAMAMSAEVLRPSLAEFLA